MRVIGPGETIGTQADGSAVGPTASGRLGKACLLANGAVGDGLLAPECHHAQHDADVDFVVEHVS